MLRFFRFNDPYRLLFVFLTILVLGIKAEMEFPAITLPEFKGILVGEMMADGKRLYSEVWDSLPPVTAFAQYLLDIPFDRSTLPRHILTWIFILFQAAFFGILLINNRAFTESGYLPSFLFALLCFFSFDTVSLTREIIGSTLLLLAIDNLLKEIEFKKQRDETIHNLGFFLGLASLSSFSYIIFFIGTGILLFLFTRVNGRRFSLFVFGFFLPHLIMCAWYFWNGELNFLWTNFYSINFNFNGEALVSLQSILFLGLIPLVYFFFSLIMTRRDARLTKYQSQILQIMLLWLAFGLIEVYLTRLRTPQSLLVCVPPFAYFISHYLLLIKRKFIAETMLWIFMIGVVAMSSLSVRKYFPSIDYSKMFIAQNGQLEIKEKKIMVLDSSLSPFISNRPAGFFLDWNLARPVFETPCYYEHILMVADAFVKDPPEVILDSNNLMPGVLKYLPDVQMKYRKDGSRWVRVP